MAYADFPVSDEAVLAYLSKEHGLTTGQPLRTQVSIDHAEFSHTGTREIEVTLTYRIEDGDLKSLVLGG